MSIIFGNLTQDFVSFGTAELAYYQDVNNATALEQLNVAGAEFRKSAAADASYLVYIGTSPPLPPSIHSYSSRPRHISLHIYLHGHLGLHWRSKR